MRWIAAVLLASLALPLQAMNLVATTPSMGLLAQSVGGNDVNVTVLAPPDRDAHFLTARPSMIAATRRADLVIAVGADLEIGWLPAVLDSAANLRVLPGRPGYFEAADHVTLIDVGTPADRALGDVHPHGNPHFNLDPLRMARLAHALAERMAMLDEANGSIYRANAAHFADRIEARLPDWQARAAGAPGILIYHKDANYLAERLGVPILGYIEPLPGIPPSARHLRGLVDELRGEQGVVLHANYQPDRGPRFMARELDWPRHSLPVEPPLGAGIEEYLELIERWVEAIASAR